MKPLELYLETWRSTERTEGEFVTVPQPGQPRPEPLYLAFVAGPGTSLFQVNLAYERGWIWYRGEVSGTGDTRRLEFDADGTVGNQHTYVPLEGSVEEGPSGGARTMRYETGISIEPETTIRYSVMFGSDLTVTSGDVTIDGAAAAVATAAATDPVFVAVSGEDPGEEALALLSEIYRDILVLERAGPHRLALRRVRDPGVRRGVRPAEPLIPTGRPGQCGPGEPGERALPRTISTRSSVQPPAW